MMTIELRTLKFETTPDFHGNQGKAGVNQTCARCGKATRNPAGYVHLVDGGSVVLHPEDESKYVPDGGDLGAYPVGRECAKHFKGWFHKEG